MMIQQLNAQGPCGDQISKHKRRRNETIQLQTESTDVVELLRDATVGADCFWCFQRADWWNWLLGSSLLFWCWPQGKQWTYAQDDGMEVYVKGTLPRYHQPARNSLTAVNYFYLGTLYFYSRIDLRLQVSGKFAIKMSSLKARSCLHVQ
jgi:transposase